METTRVELPNDLVQAARLDAGSATREVTRLLALDLFRRGDVSFSRASELAQTPLEAFMDYAIAREVSPLRYGMDDLEEDRRGFERLGR